jgi:hypothetical protein
MHVAESGRPVQGGPCRQWAQAAHCLRSLTPGQVLHAQDCMVAWLASLAYRCQPDAGCVTVAADTSTMAFASLHWWHSQHRCFASALAVRLMLGLGFVRGRVIKGEMDDAVEFGDGCHGKWVACGCLPA